MRDQGIFKNSLRVAHSDTEVILLCFYALNFTGSFLATLSLVQTSFFKMLVGGGFIIINR